MFMSRHVLFRNFFACVYYVYVDFGDWNCKICLTGHKVFVVGLSCDSLCVVIILSTNIDK